MRIQKSLPNTTHMNFKIKSINALFFGTRAAGLYLLVFAAAIGIATFIENDFGTSAAQKVVYRALWFEILLVLFAGTLVYNIIQFRMVRQKKWALLIFHLAMIVILAGAGITRYFGFEGMMHIREEDESNAILSAETYLQFQVEKDGQSYRFDESVLFASLGNNHFEESYLIGRDQIDVRLKQFIPNPQQVLETDENGTAIVKVVFGGAAGREEYFIRQGERKRIKNTNFNFSEAFMPGAVNIKFSNDSLLIASDETYTYMVMATQQRDSLLPEQGYQILQLRALYSNGRSSFVFGDFRAQGSVSLISEDPKVRNESMTALDLEVSINGQSRDLLVFGRKGSPGRAAVTAGSGMRVAVSYGAKPIQLPFSVHLYDFQMERYPGTNSAASYASEVQLRDPRNGYTEDYRIFMNHILDYDGYRFFQSSYDQDELGTYLSVNHDFWGTWISYVGYILLTLGLIMVLFSKNTRFHWLAKRIQQIRAQKAALTVSLLMIGSMIMAQEEALPQNIVSAEHADEFSSVIVQDHKGRMKPMHTMTREILRKLARKEQLSGLTADQIVLGMMVNGHDWENVPMIKLGKHEGIQNLLGVTEKRVAYSDFFDTQGRYKLREEVRRAFSLQPIDRTVYEKELMKIDEKVNIASMVFSGRLMKIIPIPGDPNNTWVSAQTDRHGEDPPSEVADRFFSAYPAAVQASMQTGDYSLPNQMLQELKAFQNEVGVSVIPSVSKTNAEILLNELNVFGRLSVVYLLLGLAFLALLFTSVFKPEWNLRLPYQILFGLVIAGFLFHTLGLSLRWYVSGRAPWSNGYESMIYIAWTSCLAGLLFTRKSLGGLAATMILGATVLLVATLSYLDPEITPLVPVLRSYWLTIHVSLEAGSYGFLMLGALIGLINLILMMFLTQNNKERIRRIGTEMTYISEMTLIGGLIMVSIGTYLGGVWANESWGRYWGWDAKETWALVTILVYAFILHMRLIPGLRGIYAFNLASLFGWGSVIMTYYGVNYYLSGLHSYAAGDPVPVPQWVYLVVGSFILISVVAYFRKRKFDIF